jgi:hypothetical protein
MRPSNSGWRERDGFILSNGESRLQVTTEGDAIDAAVGIAQETRQLYSITYAPHCAA